ncbi:MAG TPA: glucosyl-3-phosphoglycerate synthase [Mycobacteriales bacterium]|nr:glucosyl-3-phosphoglycerate synthase [Mycobacteriales bacterium]
MSARPSAMTNNACVSVAHVHPEARAWFDRRTSRASDWPVARLVERKGATRVSVVLPCLDEEATVGRIVARIRRDLVDRTGLVDELVVMDSGSTDRSLEVAAAAGARVVRREDVLTHLPPRPGKGEVLWRSLAATTGDVIVFIDSDLSDFSPTFVTGLLGPLLTAPAVAFVKATYDRPLQSGETLLPAGGGRVTELVARPLLALHWPQLGGFVQPLGGEYAARRALLETLPFPCGYGVEFGLLVDTYAAVGLEAMAQVDLARRKHRNSDLHKLGRMAIEILQVAQARLRRPVEAPVEITQFVRDGSGYRVVDTDMTELERPPLTTMR